MSPAGASIGGAMKLMIRGGTSISCITMGIGKWILQRFYDYPGSGEPSDSFLQIHEIFVEDRGIFENERRW